MNRKTNTHETKLNDTKPIFIKRGWNYFTGMNTILGFVVSIGSIISFVVTPGSSAQNLIDLTTKFVAENLFLSDQFHITENKIESIPFGQEFTVHSGKSFFLGTKEKIPFSFNDAGYLSEDSVYTIINGNKQSEKLFAGEVRDLQKTGWRLFYGGVIKDAKTDNEQEYTFKVIPNNSD